MLKCSPLPKLPESITYEELVVNILEDQAFYNACATRHNKLVDQINERIQSGN